MAIADDFSINTATGDIRHDSGSTVYSLLEFHAYASDFSDDPANIDNDVPSKIAGIRDVLKPAIITLLNNGPEATPYNIDDTTAQYLNFGSLEQDGGNVLYTGLRSIGSPLVASSPIYVVQNGSKLTQFWPDGHVRILVKAKTGGALIDSGDVQVYSRKYGQSYSVFDVNLAAGSEQSAAITTSLDNSITLSLAAAQAIYDDITVTAGDYSLDLGNGNGSKLYKGVIDCNNNDLTDVYQGLMAACEEGSAYTINSLDGWRYRKLNSAYNENASAPFGVFAGGKFFVAQGWALINVPAADAENYQLIAHDGTSQVPPVSTGVTIGNLVSGDGVLVAISATPGGAITKDQYQLAAGNTSGLGIITLDTTPAVDTPASGTVRIGDDIYPYSSFSGAVFTLTGTLTKTYTAGDDCYIPLIDSNSIGASESVTVTYSGSSRPLGGSVRRGSGGDAIVSFPISGTMGDTAVAINVVRNSEVG